MPNEKHDGHENELVAKLYQEIRAGNEAAKELAVLEQERLAALRDILGEIQSQSVVIGELSSKIDELSTKQDGRLGEVESSVRELHRVFMGFISYLNNELMTELQSGRVTQEGLGQLMGNLHRGLTESVVILHELGVEIEGPPGFDKFGGAAISGLGKVELLELLSDRMSDDELRILCFSMGVNWDEDLEGDTKLLKIASFIRYINQRRLATEFKRELMRMRPDINGFDVSKSQRFPTRPLGKLADNKEQEMQK